MTLRANLFWIARPIICGLFSLCLPPGRTFPFLLRREWPGLWVLISGGTFCGARSSSIIHLFPAPHLHGKRNGRDRRRSEPSSLRPVFGILNYNRLFRTSTAAAPGHRHSTTSTEFLPLCCEVGHCCCAFYRYPLLELRPAFVGTSADSPHSPTMIKWYRRSLSFIPRFGRLPSSFCRAEHPWLTSR